MAKQHLGNGVYAEYQDDHTIRLSVPTDGYGDAEVINLEPNMLFKLGEFAMKEAKAHAN